MDSNPYPNPYDDSNDKDDFSNPFQNSFNQNNNNENFSNPYIGNEKDNIDNQNNNNEELSNPYVEEEKDKIYNKNNNLNDNPKDDFTNPFLNDEKDNSNKKNNFNMNNQNNNLNNNDDFSNPFQNIFQDNNNNKNNLNDKNKENDIKENNNIIKKESFNNPFDQNVDKDNNINNNTNFINPYQSNNNKNNENNLEEDFSNPYRNNNKDDINDNKNINPYSDNINSNSNISNNFDDNNNPFLKSFELSDSSVHNESMSSNPYLNIYYNNNEKNNFNINNNDNNNNFNNNNNDFNNINNNNIFNNNNSFGNPNNYNQQNNNNNSFGNPNNYNQQNNNNNSFGNLNNYSQQNNNNNNNDYYNPNNNYNQRSNINFNNQNNNYHQESNNLNNNILNNDYNMQRNNSINNSMSYNQPKNIKISNINIDSSNEEDYKKINAIVNKCEALFNTAKNQYDNYDIKESIAMLCKIIKSLDSLKNTINNQKQFCQPLLPLIKKLRDKSFSTMQDYRIMVYKLIPLRFKPELFKPYENQNDSLMNFCMRYIFNKPFITFEDIFEDKSFEESKKLKFILTNSIFQAKKYKTKCFLLYGPKGCGKTLYVHALANHLGAKIAQIEGIEFFKIPFFAREFIKACFWGIQSNTLIIFIKNVEQMFSTINNFNYIYDRISSSFHLNIYFFVSSSINVYDLPKQLNDKFHFRFCVRPVANCHKSEYIKFIGQKIGIEIKINDDALKNIVMGNLNFFSNEDIFELIRTAIEIKKQYSPPDDENWVYKDGLYEDDIMRALGTMRGSLNQNILKKYYM